jgi:hypothetical protein
MKLRLKTKIIAILVVFVVATALVNIIFRSSAQSTPVVGAFFYLWYGNSTTNSSSLGSPGWNSSSYPGGGVVVDEPSSGFYVSDSNATFQRQISQMQEANISLAIVSWWGTGNHDETAAINKATLDLFKYLKRTNSSFKVAIMVDAYNGSHNLSNSSLTEDYNYIYDNFVQPFNQWYFVYEGKPLLLFFNPIYPQYNDTRFAVRTIGNRPNPVNWIFWQAPKKYFDSQNGTGVNATNDFGDPYISSDGEVSIVPRIDSYYNYLSHYQSGYLRFDENLSQGLYRYEWAYVVGHKTQVRLVLIYSFNEYHERSEIEPHHDATASVNSSYLLNITKQYANDLLTWNTSYDKNKAVKFLDGLYNPTVGLAREYNGSKTYWIYNDNALLFQILNINGENETRDNIGTTINDYSEDYDFGNNRIEVLFNKTISYPPYTGTGEYYSPIINSDMVLGNNLVRNPSVENGSIYPDYWYPSDPNLIMTPWTTKYARSGLRSIGLNVTSAEADWRCQNFTVEPSANYLVRCYVEGNVTSGNWFVYLRWFNSSQQYIGQNFTQIWPGTYSNWTQMILFNFTCPSDAHYADIRFMANGTGELYADDFEARQIINGGTFIVRNDRNYIQLSNWTTYADLRVYGILDEWLSNNVSVRAKALSDFRTLINTMCTPEGVNDSKSGGEYQTYKTALVLICSKILNQSIPYNYTQVLYQLQMPNGGFITDYGPGMIPDPNATENVETTCLALYALNEPPQPWRTIPEFPDAFVLLILMSLAVVFAIAKKFVKNARYTVSNKK